MKKLHFSVKIMAPAEKVWNILWGDATYTLWTAPFCEGSSAVTDWEEGSEVLFFDDKGSGMFSMIARKVPNEFMSFRHLGEMKDSKKLPANEKSKAWEGAMEDYTLKKVEGLTKLSVYLDILDTHESCFTDTFPEALKKVKELSEKENIHS